MAQKTAANALRTAEDSLDAQRASLKALQKETQGAAHRFESFPALTFVQQSQ